MSRQLWMTGVGDPEHCGAKPTAYSSARCEEDSGHDGWHTGRTRGGYWKSWLALPETLPTNNGLGGDKAPLSPDITKGETL